MASVPSDSTADPGARPPADQVEAVLEAHRRELTGYCYRMLGAGSEAEDAVQETMVRAWRGIDAFEGRSALRSWLYRIATNVCLDMLRGAQRRARPVDLGPSASADSPLGTGLPDQTWVLPIPDGRVLPSDGDPAELASLRETVRLAFVAALQHLPPRQRAVLILREVLRWKADEVADLLDTTVASVNSALQRARATLAADNFAAASSTATDPAAAGSIDSEHQALLARYVDAFERYDIDSLVSLIHEDATFTMPPFELWLRGTPDIARWYLGQGRDCRGSRLIATSANGCAAFGAYKPRGPGRLVPFALQIIEMSDGKITGLHHFLEPGLPGLFAEFGLPPHLEPGDRPSRPERDLAPSQPPPP